MHYKKLKLSAVLMLGFGLTGIHAQEAISSSGGNASAGSGTVSYTVGQIVYTSNAGTNGSLAQGVQQPYEISVVTEYDEANGITLQYSSYPNPATDYIKLKVENFKTDDLTYQLFGINGKLLENKKIKSNETRIAMSDFVPAVYFLKVININKEIKTFKIIKIVNSN